MTFNEAKGALKTALTGGGSTVDVTLPSSSAVSAPFFEGLAFNTSPEQIREEYEEAIGANAYIVLISLGGVSNEEVLRGMSQVGVDLEVWIVENPHEARERTSPSHQPLEMVQQVTEKVLAWKNNPTRNEFSLSPNFFKNFKGVNDSVQSRLSFRINVHLNT